MLAQGALLRTSCASIVRIIEGEGSVPASRVVQSSFMWTSCSGIDHASVHSNPVPKVAPQAERCIPIPPLQCPLHVQSPLLRPALVAYALEHSLHALRCVRMSKTALTVLERQHFEDPVLIPSFLHQTTKRKFCI